MADDDEQADENWIERNSKTITTLATVSIPIVIAIFGYFANRSLQQDELDQSYVVLAINTLKAELPVNERTACVSTVNGLQDDDGGSFDTAADLARAFQQELSDQVETDPPSTGTNLPQTLFRSYALDLLLASTPATLTVPQYKALLCAETLVPPLADQPVAAPAESDAGEGPATGELYSRLVANAVDADEDCEVRITEGTVDAVDSGSLSASDDVYVVKRVAIERIPASAESEGASTAAPTEVLYLEVEVDSADKRTLLWIRSDANVDIQPDRDTCTP
jgi:hypothetical protein